MTQIEQSDTLSVRELMYGMMLPSGNDAAVCLGTHFGGVIRGEGKLDPVIVVSPEAVERRLRAVKIVRVRDYLEQQLELDDLNDREDEEELKSEGTD